ncbi:TetR/AcrR family transcriptional regulator [Treponema pectinovorum]|uniref:TetR/AcrR family transcriptional regulator n=1 Tax=Treponema pectinovorum TaxID=164 RepID=UPI0011C7AA2A|nr:TetR/AcrR family transcriptional regulator [Treponema pectinovorum]
MAIVVEHEKRKREILEKAMELFCRDGYEDVTFQKIADACGITRTTLYIYFKNKHEIFNFSIKQLSSNLEVKFLSLVKDHSIKAEDCLRKIVTSAVDLCYENRSLFEVLIPYLTGLYKTGVDVYERVRRRTIKINHLLSMVLIRGQKNGEFKGFSVKAANDLLFGLIVESVFKMAVLHNNEVDNVKASLNLAIDGFVNK